MDLNHAKRSTSIEKGGYSFIENDIVIAPVSLCTREYPRLPQGSRVVLAFKVCDQSKSRCIVMKKVDIKTTALRTR